jgi:hypothetical protein
MGIFRYHTLEYVQVERLLCASSLTHGISPTILFWRCQPSGIGDNQELPAGVLKKISLHLKHLN